MKKALSPLLVLFCFAGAAAAHAEAMNVDAITTAPLHVRSGPAKHYKSHDILPPDFPLVVGNCTRSWCQVYYSGTSGWSSLHYLAFRKGSKHYKDPNLGPFAETAAMPGPPGPRKHRSRGRRHRGHRVAYSVHGGQADARGHAGWWTNYHRPAYQRAWQPRWWQKKGH